MPFSGGLVRAETVHHRAAADDVDQRVAGVEAAGPGIGLVVDAGLIEIGRVRALEPIGDVAELNRVAVRTVTSRAHGSGEQEEARNQGQKEFPQRHDVPQMAQRLVRTIAGCWRGVYP